MFICRTLFFLVVGLSISACSPLPLQAKHLAGKHACCSKISDFRFRKLYLNRSVDIDITEQSSVYTFPEGKSYLEAFKFPVGTAIKEMTIKTYSIGMFVPDSQLFCPVVTYLDKQMLPISTTKSLSLNYMPAGIIKSGYWYSNVTIPESAKYAVIHTPSKVIGKMISLSTYSTGYAYSTGSSFVYVPGGPVVQQFPCGQIGEIVVELKD